MDSSFFYTTCAAATSFFALLVTLFFMFYKIFRFREYNKTEKSTSLSILPRNWTHNVFPSFHGADVRKSFLSHFLKECKSKGIDSFIDNEITRGEFIGPELKEAIRGSRIAIVLLSKRYASSSWCLDELVEIMECNEDLSYTVSVIFYEVDPSDVKKQTGEFGKVFKKTCKGKTNEIIGRWTQALATVATIAGYHSSNSENDANLIEKVVTDVSDKLFSSTRSRDFDDFVGMEAHMENMRTLLNLQSDEVKMIGIWGPPGIGKSTIARCLFNQVSNNFQFKAIMVNIKGSYPRPCLDEYSAQLQLQNQMLSQIINQKDIMITHLEVARERLKDKTVFIVLDDVDRLAQLNALAKEIRWFGPGSKIIITTEDLKLLMSHGINHIYKVDFPSTDEALQMFCMYAFGQKSPKDGFTELSHKVTYLAGKLPLGLKVMGSYFRGMSKQEWTRALPNLWRRLDGEIESILKFSYDSLCDEDKDLFLHIACFFNYRNVEKVEEHLANKFVDVRQGIQVLVEKSLLSINDGKVEMHSLLAQLGKEIVSKQSDREPGKRQFLVDDKDIYQVLIDPTTISGSIVGIYSRHTLTRDNLNINERAFEGMSKLQFLRFEGDFKYPNMASLLGCLKYISPKLQLLDWEYLPMTCLPFIVDLEFLVELIMRHSKLEKLWVGIKMLQNLKWMDFSYSKKLKEIPNLSTATNLQELHLVGCSRLVKLPSSIGNATNLQLLNLRECSSLVELPSAIGNATSLEVLDLSGCSSLVELPSSIGNLTNLQTLNLMRCSSLVELPFSIGNATNLKKIELHGCSSLVELPSSIGNATNLKKISLSYCSSLVEIPFSIGNATNLQELHLSGCSSMVKLPSSIGNATNLKKIDLSHCSSLVELPLSIGNATNLQKLYLRGCSSLLELPSSIGNATNLKKLDLGYCSSLVELSIGNATSLQELCVTKCSNLVKLHSSIGSATDLQELDFKGCSSLVELPTSIGNLHRLTSLSLEDCSKLQVLPTNINLESLIILNLTNCSSLKCFPEISANIKVLKLSGAAIEEVPSSIRSWSSLEEMCMSYSENLKESPHAFDRITELHLTDTRVEELSPWVKELSRLRRLVLNEMPNLVSLSQLPDSLLFLDAANCESLERLDCSFSNPDIQLNFRNCFKLNQEARDLITRTSTREAVVLPGVEVPACFTYRSTESSIIVKLNEKPLCTSIKFKACVLLVSEREVDWPWSGVKCRITSRQNARTSCSSYGVFLKPFLSKHLYIFEVEAEEVTSKELVFEFRLQNSYYSDCDSDSDSETGTDSDTGTWKIKECGVVKLLELHRDEDFQSLDEEICALT